MARAGMVSQYEAGAIAIDALRDRVPEVFAPRARRWTGRNGGRLTKVARPLVR